MESTISLPKQLQHPGYTTVDKALGCVYSSCTLFAKMFVSLAVHLKEESTQSIMVSVLFYSRRV